jgi:hypothetical protein
MQSNSADHGHNILTCDESHVIILQLTATGIVLQKSNGDARYGCPTA